MPLPTRYVMEGIARGYKRVSGLGDHASRMEAVAHAATWFAWASPDSVVYLPSVDAQTDAARIEYIFGSTQHTPHAFFRQEFSLITGDKHGAGIARAYQDYLCIAPLHEADLKKATLTHLSRQPTLVLIPELFDHSSKFLSLITEKLGKLPNVQIAALSDAKH